MYYPILLLFTFILNCVYSRDSNFRRPSGDGYSQQEVSIGSTHEVMVPYVKDPDLFQVIHSLDNSTENLFEYTEA